MKLLIENNKMKTPRNTSNQEVYQLHFHTKNIAQKTMADITEKEVFYMCIDASNNVEKAFDILFESMLKNEADSAIDNTN